MNTKPMKLLIIEDDATDCSNFMNCIKNRNDFDLTAITDSDIDGLKLVKSKHPDGIILDLELNHSASGNTDSIEFLYNLKNLNLGYKPIVIVTTHVTSQRIYDILHRDGADIILYKNHPKYSCEHVLNKFLTLRTFSSNSSTENFVDSSLDDENKISKYICNELDLIGVTANLKGRQYIHDAILYLIKNNDNSNISVIQYLTKIHKKSATTITNGIQNAIIHAWRISSYEDISILYTAKINYETGLPTPMEFIYYYVDKIRKSL